MTVFPGNVGGSGKQEGPVQKSFLAYVVIIIACAAPTLLNWAGFDFGSPNLGFDIEEIASWKLSYPALEDEMFYALTGGLQHALLEWSAVSLAIVVGLLSFVHYRINQDVMVPIIGVAVLCSGFMDAFHTLAATRLIDAVALNIDLIPVSWALSRSFHVVILLLGVLIVFAYGDAGMKGGKREAQRRLYLLITVSLLFMAAAYGLIHLAATSEDLPRTQFPDSLVTRPYDAIPLALFVLAIPLFLKLYKKKPTFFSAALIFLLLPEIVLEAHMAFGSSALFDNHFNIAHFLKIVAYLVPLTGLLLDYVQTHLRVTEEETARDGPESAASGQRNR